MSSVCIVLYMRTNEQETQTYWILQNDTNHLGRVFTVSSEARDGWESFADYRDAGEYQYLPKRSKSALHTWARQLDDMVSSALISVKRS